MQISATEVTRIVTTSQVHLNRFPYTGKHRYVIRAEGGFLAPCTGIGGVPVELVDFPTSATQFADMETAIHRARLLTKLGWQGLRIVEVLLPFIQPG